MDGEIIDRTVSAIEEEILTSPLAGRPAKTIFFGGGTPTFLSASALRRLLRAVHESHPPIGEIEITSEANPGTVDIPKFEEMVDAGFNRISLGAQSFSNSDLIRLGRVHEADHIARAVGAARKAGFKNLNLDLMFALPGQSMAGWRRNLVTALSLDPDHLSLYGLTIEANTRYYRHHLKGMLDIPDDETQIAMYDYAVQVAEEAGLQQYEISNFAKPGKECEHNLCYWRGEEYIGYGPGAVGAVAVEGVRRRATKIKHPRGYSDAVSTRADLDCESETLPPETLNIERIMLGIRLNDGIDPQCVDLDWDGVETCLQYGWLSRSERRIRLTAAGRHVAQEVAVRLSPVGP